MGGAFGLAHAESTQLEQHFLLALILVPAPLANDFVTHTSLSCPLITSSFSCTIFSDMVCCLLSNGVSRLHSTRDLQTMSLFLFAKLILPDLEQFWLPAFLLHYSLHSQKQQNLLLFSEYKLYSCHKKYAECQCSYKC